MDHLHFAQSFREAAPYIQYLRGKTIVIGIASNLLDNATLNEMATDFNLIAALGVRLVLVHGCSTQINALCQEHKHQISFHQHRRITDLTVLHYAKQVCGQIQFDLQAALSLGYTHAPQKPPRLRTVTGNYLTAKPLGVLDGMDMQYTGMVRKVDTQAIVQSLDTQAIVIISPISASPIGQSYNLAMPDTARAVAVALQAEKLIFLTEDSGILNPQKQLISNLTVQEAEQLLTQDLPLFHQQVLLSNAIEALNHHISRVHILSGRENGSLIKELFTRQGTGTSIAQNSFIQIRPAHERDIADIISLIRPLENRGILVRRSKSYLEDHIREFSLLEHDNQIYGCVALKTFADAEDSAELACLVVSDRIRDAGYGDRLLTHVINEAKKQNKTKLFALSTQTADWFLEHGFQAAQLNDLPASRQQEYHQSARQSKIFILPL
ncbi:MAG: amino-acid N-acetyltransferase [Neisseriaceae bacterium]|nr:amino-acid N-acetyltransferase [Neisseriaceae bacterium]